MTSVTRLHTEHGFIQLDVRTRLEAGDSLVLKGPGTLFPISDGPITIRTTDLHGNVIEERTFWAKDAGVDDVGDPVTKLLPLERS